MLTHALEYAASGLLIFPVHSIRDGKCTCGKACGRDGKHPIVAKGFLKATAAEAQIRAWWEAYPFANIGLPATMNNRLIVDLDVKGDKNGPEQWQMLLDSLGVETPHTLTARTGGGGWHYHFLKPEGVEIKNDSDWLPGVDTRTSGYVLLPPSLHLSGCAYMWDAPGEPAPMPAELVAWFISKQTKPVETFAPARPTSEIPDAYARAALEGELEKLRNTPIGGQNVALNKCAFTLGQLVSPGLLDEGDVRQRITEVVLNWPFDSRKGPWTVSNMRRTLDSGLEDGKRQPRQVTTHASNGASNGNGKRPAEVQVDVAPEGEPGQGAGPEPVMDPDALHNTDIGNSLRFAALHQDKAFYCAQEKAWHIWDGTRWKLDETLAVQELAKAVVRSIYEEAIGLEWGERKKRLMAWALKSEEAGKQRDMASLARSDPRLAVLFSDMDTDPWLLNCPNGTLDLRTGELHDHDPSQRITRSTNVPYDPDAECPLWLECLERWMEPTPEVIPFLQKSLGYCLTGDTREQCMWILHGRGRNGKSKFIETITAVLGDYGIGVPARTFEDGRKDSETLANIAKLAGTYLVTAEENERTAKLATGLVKQATGSKFLTGKFLYAQPITFRPQFKLWLATNHKPVIADTDEGIWRRLRLVPWQVQFSDEEADLEIGEKLMREAPGILAWMAYGTRKWREFGLTAPAVVTAATAEYRQDSDSLGAFLSQAIAPADNGHILLARIHVLYQSWARRNNERDLSSTKLTQLLKDRPELDGAFTTRDGRTALRGYVERDDEEDQYATRPWDGSND